MQAPVVSKSVNWLAPGTPAAQSACQNATLANRSASLQVSGCRELLPKYQLSPQQLLNGRLRTLQSQKKIKVWALSIRGSFMGSSLKRNLLQPRGQRPSAKGTRVMAPRAESEVPVAPEADSEEVFLEVRAKDTLSELADKFNSKVSEWTAVNQIADVNAIQVGKFLKVPKEAWRGEAPKELADRIVVHKASTPPPVSHPKALTGKQWFGASSSPPPPTSSPKSGPWSKAGLQVLLLGVLLVLIGLFGLLKRDMKKEHKDKQGFPPNSSGGGSDLPPAVNPDGGLADDLKENTVAPTTSTIDMSKTAVNVPNDLQTPEGREVEVKSTVGLPKVLDTEEPMASLSYYPATYATPGFNVDLPKPDLPDEPKISPISSLSYYSARYATPGFLAESSPQSPPAVRPFAAAIESEKVKDAEVEQSLSSLGKEAVVPKPEEAAPKSSEESSNGGLKEASIGLNLQTASLSKPAAYSLRFDSPFDTPPILLEEPLGASLDSESEGTSSPSQSSSAFAVEVLEKMMAPEKQEGVREEPEDPIGATDSVNMGENVRAVPRVTPAVAAVGAGAAATFTAGWQGGLEMIGLAILTSFVTSELLFSEKRRALWEDIISIRSHRQLVSFLERRNITPKP